MRRPHFGLPLLGKELLEQAARKRTYVIRTLYASLLFFVCYLMFYDTLRVGWKHETIPEPVDPKLSEHEARFIYDTSRNGLGNGGHTFGDKLSGDDRTAVIEYLKTL